MPFSSYKSPKNIYSSALTIPHCFATEMAVNALSPVAIAMFISALFKVSMILDVIGFSLFERIKNPKNYNSDSTSSR
jgi:hypothetical protein